MHIRRIRRIRQIYLRLYHVLRRNYQILRSSYTTFCEKIFCFENNLDYSSSSIYVHISERSYPFGCTTGSPPEFFYRGEESWVQVGLHNLRSNITKFCEAILPNSAKRYYQNLLSNITENCEENHTLWAVPV